MSENPAGNSAGNAGNAGNPGNPGGPVGEQPRHNAAHDIRNLRRSTDDRMIAGVCGGLGRYSGIDPVVFRIVLAVLAVFGGVGILIYALGWLLVPDDTARLSPGQQLLRGNSTTSTILAVILAIIGVLILFDVARHGRHASVIVIVMLAGLGVVVANRRGWSRGRGWTPPPGASGFVGPTGPGGSGAAPWTGPTPPSNPTEPFGPTPPVGPTEPLGQPGPVGPLGPPAGYAPPRADETAYVPPWADPASPPYGPYAPLAPKAPRQPSLLAPLGVSAGLIVAGVLFALGASGAVDITAQTIFAAALLTVGVALILATWLGRARGLIAIGAALSAALVVSAAIDVPLRGGIGERDERPVSIAAIPSAYRLAIGNEWIDLSQLPSNSRTPLHVVATLGIGQLHVTLPDDVKAVITSHVGMGRNNVGGIGSATHRTVLAPLSSTPQPGEIDLDLHTGIGEIYVEQQTTGVPAPLIPTAPAKPGSLPKPFAPAVPSVPSVPPAALALVTVPDVPTSPMTLEQTS